VLLIAFTALLVLTHQSNSQIFYVKAGVGYGFGTATQLLSSTVDSGNTEGHYGSYGEGILPALGFGYMFNSNVAVELDGTYLIGKKFEHTHSEGTVTETHNQWGEGILLSPALVIQAPLKSVTPYARFGGVLGFVKVKEEETESGTGARTGTDIHEETGKIASGFNGAFGMKFKAGKSLNIFAEVFAQSMTYAPEKRENTETFSGGTLDPTITYEEEFSNNTANTRLTPRHPFSNFGLNVGVIFTFGKAKVKK
jgi:outer membrane protein W